MHSSGILLHISSLPGKYGIGTMGADARKFVKFLVKSGQEYWQILPIGPTGYGDSPYQSYSAYAGNPLLIDLETLIGEGLIDENDGDLQIMEKKQDFADYAQLYSFKHIVLKKACDKFMGKADKSQLDGFDNFCKKNKFWLDDYALFTALKSHFKGVMWTEWEDGIRLRQPAAVKRYSETLAKDIQCVKFIQYKFFEQYFALKKYANARGIKIYGDMPIYVSMDSSDIWASPQLFMLDGDRKPTKVAGCPPDAFSPTGQLWGNPLYDWDYMEKTGYKWWISRVRYSARLFDLTRIDHFRGFESFYAIPYGNETAEIGEWLPGPSTRLFKAIRAELGNVPLVAEDLGFLTDDVRKMLKACGYPGMYVLEFAFGGDNSGYLPHNYGRNGVVYIGTHDNDTAMGWYESCDKKTKKRAKKYMALTKKEGFNWGMIRTAYASVADLAVIQMQDFLGLGSEARMNIPSTIGGGNWAWRLGGGELTDRLAGKILKYAKRYYRVPVRKKIKIKVLKK
ncbi:MAG: 4-alpha-glucanotransferase [Ruminococcus sp.]|nr:4-alpha-glucanotransferase [Ruminococcus sp.]MCM1381494.1 4-alpha-glucanotransferase [Muribaculaceae bacterium]MCM1479882.1 4-alpha-glucanotransferase [Muribaculaceae bacterium]